MFAARRISSSNTKNLKNVVQEPDTLLHSTIQIPVLMNFSLDPEEWHLHTRVHSSSDLKTQKPKRKPTWLAPLFRFPSAIEPKIGKVESQKRFIPLQHPIKLGLSCISVFVQVVISWFGRAEWNQETKGEEEQHYFTHARSLRPENGLYTARSGTVPSASPICRLLWHSSSSLTPSFHPLFLRPCPLPYSTLASSPRFTSAPASSSPPPYEFFFRYPSFSLLLSSLGYERSVHTGPHFATRRPAPFSPGPEDFASTRTLFTVSFPNVFRHPSCLETRLTSVLLWICSQCGRAGNFGSKFQSFTRVLAIWFIFQRNIFAADYNWHAIPTELWVFPRVTWLAGGTSFGQWKSLLEDFCKIETRNWAGRGKEL